MPRKDYKPGSSYKFHPGMIAWYLHRASGLFLAFYFLFHMIGSGAGCQFLSSIVQNSIVEGIAIVTFAWHAMNGLRIIFMEFFGAAERESFKKWLIIFSCLAVILAAVGVVQLVPSADTAETANTEEAQGE